MTNITAEQLLSIGFFFKSEGVYTKNIGSLASLAIDLVNQKMWSFYWARPDAFPYPIQEQFIQEYKMPVTLQDLTNLLYFL